jgi:hypothetical protein
VLEGINRGISAIGPFLSQLAYLLPEPRTFPRFADESKPGLNKGEARNALAKAVFFHWLCELGGVEQSELSTA